MGRTRLREQLQRLARADLGSTRAAGQLSAMLFFLCGLLVVVGAPLIPAGPGVHRDVLVAVGLVAAASGIVILALPWGRWPRPATLALVPLAFTLIALHNWSTGADGLRYDVFFLVVAAWMGLMHPGGTATASVPGMVVAYLAPAAGPVDLVTLVGGLAYAVPVFILIGESCSLVAERVRESEEELRTRERRFRALVQNAADVITVIGADGSIMWESPGIETMLGYPANTRTGTNGLDFVHPDHLAATQTALLELIGDPTADVTVELPVRHARGEWRWCEVRARNLLDEPAVRGIVINFSDITARHEAQRATQALADTAASFRLLFFANPHPMWVYDSETLRFLEVNEAAVQHYGWRREQFLEMTVLDIRPPEDRELLMRNLAEDRESRETSSWRHLLADGRVIDVDITSHRLDFGGRDALLVAVQDVTDRNALESQLRHQAFHDTLTGLSNRALFGDRVEHALRRRSDDAPPVVLLLDLDRFKVINDSLGHAVGDELLVSVATRLRSAVRAGDTVARLGGDEFAVLLDECPPGAAVEQADRLLEAVACPLTIDGKQIVVSGSVGIAAAEADVSAGELLRNADMAMYRAKASGGNCHRTFEPTMHTDALRQMEINGSLRQAIEGEEFVLHYQPVVATGDGRVIAMEALVRWQRDGALLPPADFIPALEDTGLIVALGEWILRRACLDAASWPAPAIQVNVNLSGRQLADPAIVRHVRSALEVSGLPPHRLMLEITESVLMHNGEASVRRLAQLHELGVGIAIDDFGTGYSSLSYLRTFPVDELKIDKSFIDTIVDDPTAVPLVRTIVQLARSLQLCTVAEGVETKEQYDVLRELGCDHVQGYLVARPQPVADALTLRSSNPGWAAPAQPPVPVPQQRAADDVSGRPGEVLSSTP